MKPKLIATDLDGTIVQFNGRISPRTVETFNRALDEGVRIIYATGRPPRWMGDVVDAFGTERIPWAICCNGALLFDLVNDKIVEEWPISIEITKEILHRMRQAIPEITFAMERHNSYVREKNYIPRWDAGLDTEGIDAIEELLDQPFLKLLARVPNHVLDSDEMLAIAAPLLADIATVTHSNAEDSLLEISALGVNKGTGVRYVASQWGIPIEDVVCFGDNPNDIPMLNLIPRSYAVQSGHRDAHTAAAYIAPACNDDGVAQVISDLLG